jgi:hypothetical protein
MDIDDLFIRYLLVAFLIMKRGKYWILWKNLSNLVDWILSEFEQEVWQKYLSLKACFAGGCNAEASQPRSVAAKAQQPKHERGEALTFT